MSKNGKLVEVEENKDDFVVYNCGASVTVIPPAVCCLGEDWKWGSNPSKFLIGSLNLEPSCGLEEKCFLDEDWTIREFGFGNRALGFTYEKGSVVGIGDRAVE